MTTTPSGPGSLPAFVTTLDVLDLARVASEEVLAPVLEAVGGYLTWDAVGGRWHDAECSLGGLLTCRGAGSPTRATPQALSQVSGRSGAVVTPCPAASPAVTVAVVAANVLAASGAAAAGSAGPFRIVARAAALGVLPQARPGLWEQGRPDDVRSANLDVAVAAATHLTSALAPLRRQLGEHAGRLRGALRGLAPTSVYGELVWVAAPAVAPYFADDEERDRWARLIGVYPLTLVVEVGAGQRWLCWQVPVSVAARATQDELIVAGGAVQDTPTEAAAVHAALTAWVLAHPAGYDPYAGAGGMGVVAYPWRPLLQAARHAHLVTADTP